MAKVYWHMTREVYDQFKAISDEMIKAAQAGDRLRLQEATDRFRAIPGRPMGMHPDLDWAVPLVSDVSTKIVTIGSVN